jgi:hypothetical protein
MRRATWVWLCALALLLSGASHASTPKLSGATLVGGQLIAHDKSLSAGAGGARLRIGWQTELALEPGTTFRLGAQVKLAVPHGATPLVRTRTIIVERGRVDVSLPVQKRPDFACLVVGPDQVQMLVTGGRSTLIVRQGRTTVATESGEGLVSNGGGWLPLPEGTVRAYDGQSPGGVERQYPAAPAWPTLSSALLFAGTDGESSARVTWPASAPDVRYELAIENVSTHERRVLAASETQLDVGGFAVGSYKLSVRALDRLGFQSPWSESVPLQVIGFELPESARLEASGALSLLPGQRVRLIGAANLEVGYAGFDQFMPLPESLGLVQRRPITVVLRNPATHETVRLRLEPLTVKAEIELPNAPRRWPVGGLPLTVRLKDQKGRLVSGVRAEVQVSVNLEEQKLEWQRGEGTWSAVVPSAVGESPWLVRVNVVDEHGVSLGMDFAEIGYESAASASATRPR